MKRIKAALACILSATIIASLFPIGYAENQSDTEENTVELVNAQTDGRTLLDINYDDKFKEIDRFGSPKTALVTGDNGNKYLNIDCNWSCAGYYLNKKIPKNGEFYDVSFDFAVNQASGEYFLLMLSDKASESQYIYDQFGLIGAMDSGEFRVANMIMPNIKWEKGKWYSYFLRFNRENNYITATITDKEDQSNTSTSTIWADPAGYSGYGMPDRDYDFLRFYSQGSISLDNVLIKESEEIPFVVSKVSSDHVGNIFGANDEKVIYATFKNVLDAPLTANVKYTVVTEDGETVDNGELKDVKAGTREKKIIPITLNLPKFYTYRVYFDVEAVNNETGVTKAYTSDRWKLSMVNKQMEDEPKNPYTGVCQTYVQTPDVAKQVIEILDQSGIKNIRQDAVWLLWDDRGAGGDLHEHPTGDWWADLAKKGIEVMPIIAADNAYFKGNVDVPGKGFVHDMAAAGIAGIWDRWEEYVRYVAEKKKGQYTKLSIINEPNGETTPEEYAEYAKRAYKIIKDVDPKALVVGPELYPMPWDWVEGFLKYMSEHPDEKFIDVFSFHPYDCTEEDEWVTHSTVPGLRLSIIFRDSLFQERRDIMYGLLKKYGLEDKLQLYATEIGMSTTRGMFSLKLQAAELSQLYLQNQAIDFFDVIDFYNFENNGYSGFDEYDVTWGENNFGMINSRKDPVPFAAKPSYVAMCGYNKIMSGAEFVDEIVDMDTWTRAYRFNTRDGKQTVSLWSEYNNKNIALDLGTNSVEIYDQYSNYIGTVNSENGTYDFTATFEPIYIKGNFTKFEQDKSTVTLSTARINAVANDTGTINIYDKLGRNLRVEVSDSPEAKVTVNTGVTNGYGRLVIETNENAREEEPIEIKIYDGDALVFYTMAHVIIAEDGLEVKYSIGSDPNAADRNVINVSVTNKTAGTTFDGKVSADLTDIGGKNEKRTIVDLEAGQSKTVYVNIPKLSNVKTFNMPIHVSLGERFTYSDVISFIDAMPVAYNDTGKKGLEVLDTDLSGSKWFAADDELSTSSIADWRGKEDCSFKSTLRWDEDYLYLYADVTDDVFFQNQTGANIWQADSIQLGIVPAENISDPTGTKNNCELGMAKTSNGDEIFKFRDIDPIGANNTSMSSDYVKIETQKGRTIYKAAIPWSEIIGRSTVKLGDSFRFTMLANDNDGAGRRGWAQLTDGIAGQKNPDWFGIIELKK